MIIISEQRKSVNHLLLFQQHPAFCVQHISHIVLAEHEHMHLPPESKPVSMYLIVILLIISFSAASAFSGNGFSYRRNMISTTDLKSSKGNISTSSRIQETLDPCVVLMKQIITRHQHLWEDNDGIYSLAQGKFMTQA